MTPDFSATETPFDGVPEKGRTFTPAEVEDRKRRFGELFDVPAEDAMPPAHERHLQSIKDAFVRLVDAKYRRGAAEHGGKLWEKDDLLGEAINEAIDLVVYLLTLKEKLEKESLSQCGDRGLGSPAAGASDRSRSRGEDSKKGIDVVKVLVEEPKKRTVRYRDTDGEWKTREEEVCQCFTDSWRDCDCPLALERRDWRARQEAKEFAAKLDREDDTYTREEIDKKMAAVCDAVDLLRQWFTEDDERLGRAQSLFHKGLKLEEKQWRKSVLDVLRCIVIAVNNNKPRDGTGVEFAESDLRKRFLS